MEYICITVIDAFSVELERELELNSFQTNCNRKKGIGGKKELGSKQKELESKQKELESKQKELQVIGIGRNLGHK